MKIGMFTSDFPFKGQFFLDGLDPAISTWGGVAEVVYNMSLSLNAKGHTVKVFTTSPTRKDIVQEHENITVFRYGKDLQVASTLLSLGLVRGPLRHDLDLVHGHLGTPPGAYAASYYARRRKTPFVLTIHTPYNNTSLSGASFPKRVSLRLFMDFFCSPLLERADAITSVSSAVLGESPYYRDFASRTHLIPNGVDLSRLPTGLTKEECRGSLGISNNELIVLFVGSLSPYKNPEILLKAFSGLDRTNRSPRLVMVGDGPLRSALEEQTKRSGVEGRVTLPGFVSEREKMLYYRAADMLVLPSLAEAFPLVLLEGAAFGLPLIVSDIDVFKAVVRDGHTGLMFRSGSQEDLRQKLAQLIENGPERETMGRNARTFAEEHDWKNILERYDKIYRGLVH